jgi:hypothetical protein
MQGVPITLICLVCITCLIIIIIGLKLGIFQAI